MQPTLRRNALLVSGLAAFFWWSFMFAKHDSLLRPIIPFGEDPYDAMSSFGAIAAVLLALLSLTRAFFPKWAGRGGQPIYVLRAQAAIPFCVLVTISAEAVAMARHVSSWVGRPGSFRLVALQAALALFSLAALILIKDTGVGGRRPFARAAAIWGGSLLILAVYPEHLILSTPGHLLTVILGDVLLFVPVSVLVRARVPDGPPSAFFEPEEPKGARRYRGFAVAAVIGLIVGFAAYAGELNEDRFRPALMQILFVGSVFVGLGAAGVVIAYACLGRLLGFSIAKSDFK